ALPATADGVGTANFANLPPGATGFSMVSTANGSGVCTHSVEYRSVGDGKPPQVMSPTSGDCAGTQEPAALAGPTDRSAEGVTHAAYTGQDAARAAPPGRWD